MSSDPWAAFYRSSNVDSQSVGAVACTASASGDALDIEGGDVEKALPRSFPSDSTVNFELFSDNPDHINSTLHVKEASRDDSTSFEPNEGGALCLSKRDKRRRKKVKKGCVQECAQTPSEFVSVDLSLTPMLDSNDGIDDDAGVTGMAVVEKVVKEPCINATSGTPQSHGLANQESVKEADVSDDVNSLHSDTGITFLRVDDEHLVDIGGANEEKEVGSVETEAAEPVPLEEVQAGNETTAEAFSSAELYQNKDIPSNTGFDFFARDDYFAEISPRATKRDLNSRQDLIISPTLIQEGAQVDNPILSHEIFDEPTAPQDDPVVFECGRKVDDMGFQEHESEPEVTKDASTNELDQQFSTLCRDSKNVSKEINMYELPLVGKTKTHGPTLLVTEGCASQGAAFADLSAKLLSAPSDVEDGILEDHLTRRDMIDGGEACYDSESAYPAKDNESFFDPDSVETPVSQMLLRSDDFLNNTSLNSRWKLPSQHAHTPGSAHLAKKLRMLKNIPPSSCLLLLLEDKQDSKQSQFDSVAFLRDAEHLSMTGLYACRAMTQKMQILDAAIEMCNRDTLVVVVLWLHATLKPQLFFQEMYQRPQAVHVYSTFLREAERWDELESFQMSVRLFEMRSNDSLMATESRTPSELALSIFHRALSKSSTEEQLVVIHEVIEFGASVPRGTIWEAGQTELDQITDTCVMWRDLLEKQVDIERVDSSTVYESPPAQLGSGMNDAPPANMFVRFPRPCLLGLSLLESIGYLSLYHGDDRDDGFPPRLLRKELKVSDKLYWFSAFIALSKAGAWETIRSATVSKSFVTSKEMYKSAIGWRPLISLLYEWGNPNKDSEVQKLALIFANQIEDRLDSYHLCVNRHLWEGAIQACVDLRDEDRLVDLRVRIAKEPTHKVQLYLNMIDEVYRDTKIKWKTQLSESPTKFSVKFAAGLSGMFRAPASYLVNGFSRLSGKKGESSLFSHAYTKENHAADIKFRTSQMFGEHGGGIIDDD